MRGAEEVEVMFQYDPAFYRQRHRERVAELRADYEPLVWAKSQSRVLRGRRQIRVAWAFSLSARAVWLTVVMVPIAVIAVGVKAFMG